jgi:hypothetical protein
VPFIGWDGGRGGGARDNGRQRGVMASGSSILPLWKWKGDQEEGK